MRWMTVSCAIRRIQKPTVWSGVYQEPAGSRLAGGELGAHPGVGPVEQRERLFTHELGRRPPVGLGALAHGQGLVQVHLTDMAGQVGDTPAGTARHRRGRVGRHDAAQAGEVGSETLEGAEYSM
jgi:hypothetical protein